MWRHHGVALCFLRDDTRFAFTPQWRFIGAIYFNWLAFPFLGAIIFLFALFAIEIAKRRVIWRLGMVLQVTRWRLTVFGLSLLLLWTLQIYLAVSQHKPELLNTRGPLYVLFVR
jgi:hypothetical protein